MPDWIFQLVVLAVIAAEYGLIGARRGGNRAQFD